MGKPWHYVGGIFCKQLLCHTPGNGTGEVCHGKHAVREAGAYGKAHKRGTALRTVKRSSPPDTGGYHRQGAGGTPAGRAGFFHPCRPIREKFQLRGGQWESILPGKFKDEPGGAARKDYGACPWHGEAPGYYAGADPLPDGGRER